MHMPSRSKQTLSSNEQGMAAMVIVTILMFVISIIVLGFAQIVRREQRNALDDQLATQAYYAAESGLNLAQKKVETVLAGPTVPVEKTDCTTDPGYGIDPVNDLNVGENAKITCILIDPTPEDLKFQKIDKMHSVPFLVKSNGDTISNIYVSWQAPSDSSVTGCGTAGTTFVPGSTAEPWTCSQPLMRVDLVPVTAGMTADSAKANQYTTFLYPRGSGAFTNPAYTAGSMNTISRVTCTANPGAPNAPLSCTAKITSLPNTPGGFALRIMSIYKNADVTVFATNAADSRLQLIGGQVVVDVTAKAADVLKRLQARVPVTARPDVPDFAITAGGGVCKRYQISGGIPSIDGDTSAGGIAEGCRLN
jgi:hypothetical protein